MNENAVISNKFTVSVLEDGSQFTGVLVSNNPLTQAWNGTSAVPDWSRVPGQGEKDIRPLIYMILNYGGSPVALNPEARQYTWTYNGTTLTFSTTPKSDQDVPLRYACTNYTPGGIDYRNIFELTSYEPSTGVRVPALRVIGNLAGLDIDGEGSGTILNSDSDVIGFTAEVPLEGGRSFTIHDDVVVTITQITSGSMFGVLEATKMYLTAQDESTTITATLYNSDGSMATSTWYSKFFYIYNGVEQRVDVPSHAITLYGRNFVDYETVKVEFRTEPESSQPDPVWTAVIGIDDLQDDDVMLITSALASSKDGFASATYGPGSDASMNSGQFIKFRMYMVKKDNIQLPVNTFPYFYVQLLDYKGDEFAGQLDNNDYPVVTTDPEYPEDLRYLDAAASSYKDMILVGTDIKNKLHGSVTGMVYAYVQPIHQIS